MAEFIKTDICPNAKTIVDFNDQEICVGDDLYIAYSWGTSNAILERYTVYGIYYRVYKKSQAYPVPVLRIIRTKTNFDGKPMEHRNTISGIEDIEKRCVLVNSKNKD